MFSIWILLARHNRFLGEETVILGLKRGRGSEKRVIMKAGVALCDSCGKRSKQVNFLQLQAVACSTNFIHGPVVEGMHEA